MPNLRRVDFDFAFILSLRSFTSIIMALSWTLLVSLRCFHFSEDLLRKLSFLRRELRSLSRVFLGFHPLSSQASSTIGNSIMIETIQREAGYEHHLSLHNPDYLSRLNMTYAKPNLLQSR